ncbi:TRAP transporter small permease subunit [Ruixingdingia sedimenti]|uniref:TRAP transporter small permease protein n=1 Tax=Ruixingdingia sedimenti TaxID=3073604 RepID=A0ABU1F853_9RHOB|nr:TRAP transporter small permease [Xinfangfangia sp. LG-4]MDR5652637.1 TRAP transporter small permease [Xinfangfangia sp. LG-4]
MVKIAEKLTFLLGWIAGLTVVLMMIHVMVDVIGKYVFNAPLPGTAEVVAAYYMIGCVFLPLAWVEASGGSIVVEVIYEKVSPRARRVMLKLADIVSIIYYSVLGWFSWGVATHAWRINETVDGIWRITTWPAKFLLPFGFAIAVIVIVLRLFLGERGKVRTAGHALEI